MKPTKKVDKIATKNQVKSSVVPTPNPTVGIQAFFTPTIKSFVVNKTKSIAEPSNKNDVKSFYIDILKEKLRSARGEEYGAEEHEAVVEVCDTAFGNFLLEHGNSNVPQATASATENRNEPEGNAPKCAECVGKDLQIIDWEQKYNEEVEKRKELKKVYINTTIRLSELYSKYNDLLKTVECSKDHNANDEVATTQDDIFTEKEVKFLQCMALEKKLDCTFIHHCLKYAYKVDLAVLALRTLKGTSEWTETTKEGEQIHHEAKLPLTPKKVERIKSLFIHRISASRIDAAEYADRMKDSYVNKLFAAGIKNLSKKFKQ